MAPRPSAIISYSHDSPQHEEAVLRLAERLRADGVECVIDTYQVSPSEGWHTWMRRQIQERDFCIVVFTAAYARRFAGEETPGTGKGASWEGRLMRQMLYDAGKNDRIIPVVFDHSQEDHIALELRDATYYDLSTDDGYDRLHRAITNQPLVVPAVVGSVRRHLPYLAAQQSEVVALLGACPAPVPVDVAARAAAIPIGQFNATMSGLVGDQFVTVVDGSISLRDRSVGLPVLMPSSAGRGLEAMLDFIDHHHRDAAGRAQLSNAIALAGAADVQSTARQISRTFAVLHQLLKTQGNKHLVLELARRSIEAAKVPGRGPEQARDEAVAAVCGLSWVYQRTGRLGQARVEAERSLELGLAIGWEKNTAYCKKCLGRLQRMEAESVIDKHLRAALLDNSVDLLKDAIGRFTALGADSEVGDCHSLLARTHLVADDLESAREAVRQADQRLVEPDSKDYLDLQIVKGDLMTHSNRRSAEGIYTDVIAQLSDDDAQKSEIFARAYLHRGRTRMALKDVPNAMADFKRAAEIWDALEDPSADLAHWEIERNGADWLDAVAQRVLDAEPVAVRVRVARTVQERKAGRPVAVAKRAKLPEQYLRDLVREARERLAVDRPDW